MGLRRLTRNAVWISLATAPAAIGTVATRSGLIGLGSLAATPRAIGEGRLWLLVTSAFVADRPWLPSLLGFVVVGAVTLELAPFRVVAGAAVAGHVLATLAVYGVIDASRAADREAFAGLLDAPDVGLSAIIAAWIGVAAQVLWRRHPSPRAHALNALGCVGCVLIGLAFRPQLTALDSEHVVAFALGVAVAARGLAPRARRPRVGVAGSRSSAAAH